MEAFCFRFSTVCTKGHDRGPVKYDFMRMRYVIYTSYDGSDLWVWQAPGVQRLRPGSRLRFGRSRFHLYIGKILVPYKIDPDTAWRSHLLLGTFSMLLPSMRMAAPPTAWPRAWLSRLRGRRARANGVGVRRWAAVAPQVIATLEIGGLAQEVAPEEL